jgi:sugar/nucleoside kinase (ribokinase family)
VGYDGVDRRGRRATRGDLAEGGRITAAAPSELWLPAWNERLTGVRGEAHVPGVVPSIAPDYVLIGHIARDRLGERERLGGTVLYAGVAAARLGRRVGIVTACSPDLVLPAELATADICVVRLSATHTCTFAHDSSEGARHLRLLERGAAISSEQIPAGWVGATVVHLAPLMDEVQPDVAAAFRSEMVGATPQGWLRRVANRVGDVVPALDGLDGANLDKLTSLVLSEEDLAGDEDVANRLSDRVPVLVVTRGAAGCTLFAHGRRTDLPAYPAREVDSTGAGDVFAAAFFIRLHESRDAETSARFAACAAALSVEGIGAARIPNRDQVEARL